MCNAETQTCEELDLAESKAISNIDAPTSSSEWLDRIISHQSQMEMALRSGMEFLVEGQQREFQQQNGASPFEDDGLHGDDDEVRSYSLSADGPVVLKRSVSEPLCRDMTCAPDPVKMLSDGELCVGELCVRKRGDSGEDSERSAAATQLNAPHGDRKSTLSPDELYNLLPLVKALGDLLPVPEQHEQSSKSLQSLHPSLLPKPATRVRAMHAAVCTSAETSAALALDLSQVDIKISVAAASDPDSPRGGSGPSEASIGSACSAFTCRSKASSGSQPVSPRPPRPLKGTVSMPTLNRSYRLRGGGAEGE